MGEGNQVSKPKKGVKVGPYFLYDLDDGKIISRINPSGKDLEIKGQKYPSTQISPLTFGAIISDRRVYNPGDTVRLLVAAPGNGGANAHLDLLDSGKRTVTSDDASLDDYGVHTFSLKGIEETGEYTASVTVAVRQRSSKEEESKKSFSCGFTIAYHTLSPLLAQVRKQVISADVLNAEIEVTVLNQPYTGSIRIGLYCGFCRAVVEEKTLDVKKGFAKFDWRLSGHTGPFRLAFSTPDGNTASVMLQSTRVEERQEIQVGNLGEIVNVALVPIPDGKSIRGVNYASRGVTTAPIVVKTVEGEKILLEATRDLDYVYIYALNPFTNQEKHIPKGPVKEGEKFSIGNTSPYQIVMVGCIVSADERTLFEGRTIVFHPEKLNLEVDAPKKASPAEEVEITIKTDGKALCLIMVFDERLDHENLVGKLGKDVFNNLKSLTSIDEMIHAFDERKEMTREQAESPHILSQRSLSVGVGAPHPMMRMAGRAALPPSAQAMPLTGMVGTMQVKGNGRGAEGAIVAITTASMPMQSVAAPKRAWFPKLLMYELVEVDGSHRERVKLGDTITKWEVQVYAFAELDYVSKSASIEADQSVAVDLDIPSMVDDGDDCYGKAIYHIAGGKGTLRVVLPDGSHYEGEIEGDGIREFKVPGPGTIEADVTSPLGGDTVVKTIEAQASEKVRVSNLSLLEPNEELVIDAGKKAYVYGSMKALISQSVRALIQYPFGCAEQTSAKLCGLAIAWQFGETANEIEQMINVGLGRMVKFLRQDGFYSLWESGGTGSPDVTRKVLKNLAPFATIPRFKEKVNALFEKPVQQLLQKDTKDNSLLPLSKKFKAPISTVEDAANVLIYGDVDEAEHEQALQFIESRAIPGAGDTEAHWEPTKGTWGGTLESTATAVRALCNSNEAKHLELFKKGFKFVAKRLVGERLHSTADTRALVELFASMKEFDQPPRFAYRSDQGPTRTEKNYDITKSNRGSVFGLDDFSGSNTSNRRKLAAQTRLVARVDGMESIDYRAIKSRFNFGVKLDRTTLRLGERVKLVVTPKEPSICPVAKIFLPANTAFLEGGVNIQTMSKPLVGGSITMDIVATSRGVCKLYAMLYDMYDITMIGVAPPIKVRVE